MLIVRKIAFLFLVVSLALAAPAFAACPQPWGSAKATTGLTSNEFKQAFEPGKRANAYRQKFQGIYAFAKAYAHISQMYCTGSQTGSTICAKTATRGNRPPRAKASARPCTVFCGSNSAGNPERSCLDPFPLAFDGAAAIPAPPVLDEVTAVVSAVVTVDSGVSTTILDTGSELRIELPNALQPGERPAALLVVQLVEDATENVLDEGRVELSSTAMDGVTVTKTGLFTAVALPVVQVSMDTFAVDLQPIEAALTGLDLNGRRLEFETTSTPPSTGEQVPVASGWGIGAVALLLAMVGSLIVAQRLRGMRRA